MITKILQSVIQDINKSLMLPVKNIKSVYSKNLETILYSKYREVSDIVEPPDYEPESWQKSQILLEYAHSHLKPYVHSSNNPKINIVSFDKIVDKIFEDLRKQSSHETEIISGGVEIKGVQWEQYLLSKFDADYSYLSPEDKDKITKWINGYITGTNAIPVRTAVPFSMDVTLRWLSSDTNIINLIQIGLLSNRGSKSIDVSFEMADGVEVELSYEYVIDEITQAGLIDPQRLGSLQEVILNITISGIIISPIVSQFAQIIEHIRVTESVKQV